MSELSRIEERASSNSNSSEKGHGGISSIPYIIPNPFFRLHSVVQIHCLNDVIFLSPS